ncbi:MAG: hypothetical protein ACKVJG_02540 [Candidatus Latescibacterota bacterium]
MCKNTFSLWAFGDAHVGTDLKRGRHSLSESLRTSEQGGDRGGPPFDWDIAVDIGDMSGDRMCLTMTRAARWYGNWPP